MLKDEQNLLKKLIVFNFVFAVLKLYYDEKKNKFELKERSTVFLNAILSFHQENIMIALFFKTIRKRVCGNAVSIIKMCEKYSGSC